MATKKAAGFSHQHLLAVADLSRSDILSILKLSQNYVEFNKQKVKKLDTLKGRTLINLFFEHSTRTRNSFELAGKRLGADVINMSVAYSAVHKGETLIDTAATLNAMHPDFLAVRHPSSGAVHLLSRKVTGRVINAGDGCHEHPTQALLDALTMQRKCGDIKGLNVAICGDIFHSRVARSNMLLLNKLGAKVRVIAPPTLIPRHMAEQYDVTVHHDLREGISGTDVVMMLRLQKERMSSCFIPSEQEYFHLYGLDYDKLSAANKDVFVMHPGQINRGVEIDSELADDINRSVILDQVEMGVAVRQAILEMLA